MSSRNSKLANVLRAMDAFTAPEDDGELRDHLIDGGDIPDDAPVTCHLCGAGVPGGGAGSRERCNYVKWGIRRG